MTERVTKELEENNIHSVLIPANCTGYLQPMTLPTEWQIHTIIPIFTSGDHSAIKNYRSFFLLCIVFKVFERLVYDKTSPFLLQQLTVVFFLNRSAIQQLLSVANTVKEAFAKNKFIDVIYLDFKKAFNSVSHSKLLSKLWYLGISSNLCNWFRAYLDSWRQYVHINESISSMVPFLSGVPQESLSQLLFVVFINNLPSHVTLASVSLFADDTKCFKIISNPTDIIPLQNAISQALNWSNLNDLFFNESKFLHIHFGLVHITSPSMEHLSQYVSNCVKDLGVHL